MSQSTALQARLDELAEAWNEAEISRPSLGRWMAQFPRHRAAAAVTDRQTLHTLRASPSAPWPRSSSSPPIW